MAAITTNIDVKLNRPDTHINRFLNVSVRGWLNKYLKPAG